MASSKNVVITGSTSGIGLGMADAFARTGANKFMRFVISKKRVDSANVFLYHKTTRRGFYDDERKFWSEKTGVDEVVFVNEHGALTEGSITNIFIEKAGRLYTPRLSSGLLAGTLRAELLENGQAIETVLREKDLQAADAVYLGNSVRGLVRANFVPD